MYLKILSKDDDQTNTLMDVQQVQYWSTVGSSEVIRQQVESAELSIAAEAWFMNRGEPPGRVGNFNITFKSGKHMHVVFDNLAFLCNENGKAVERYRVD